MTNRSSLLARLLLPVGRRSEAGSELVRPGLALLASGSLALFASLAAAQPAGEAKAGQPGESDPAAVLGQCAAIAEASVRHACLDAVLQARGLLPRSSSAQAPAQPQAAKPAPAMAAARTPGERASGERASGEQGAGDRDGAKATSSTIAAAWLGADRRLVVRTTDGQVWRDTGTERWRRLPQPGDAFSVRDGALGSNHCRADRRAFRCRPAAE